ncbi:hypothetical protein CCC_03745 [Paramagnetospirillum magnetotacticum MS-1]|uniref:Uncharacterized protein n=1 Tax=Paramagnetospirillum magnetotacticum MS-1 TaxID=272627 RepID=A0A0C2UAF4_PARME|nr:hypothetical protein CCC_03745 [Paramagnetospirillum magnetotacticum MS-1]
MRGSDLPAGAVTPTKGWPKACTRRQGQRPPRLMPRKPRATEVARPAPEGQE